MMPTANEWLSAAVAIATPVSAVIDATERSNWPATISSVPGIATIPVTEIAVRTLRKLERVRNSGARIENVISSAIRTTANAVTLGSDGRRRRTASTGGADGSAVTGLGSSTMLMPHLRLRRRARWR